MMDFYSEQKQLGFDSFSFLPEKNYKTTREILSILTVSQLTKNITDILETNVGKVWVKGEISNFKQSSAGHIYFTLKDHASQISAVLFLRHAIRSNTHLKNGLEVQIFGQLTVYKSRGEYQLVIEKVETEGEGAFKIQFEYLKQKLFAEGIFDPQRKKKLPRFIQKVALITSPTSAAMQDFIHVAHRRQPNLSILIYPVTVQGKRAGREIAHALTELSAPQNFEKIDVIVITRGGGSIEDLQVFNEEIVARAISVCTIPVVTAIGHEIDFSIADFSADLRAATPSAAAEILTEEYINIMHCLRDLEQKIRGKVFALFRQISWRYQLIQSSLFLKKSTHYLNNMKQSLDRYEDLMRHAIVNRSIIVQSSLKHLLIRYKAIHPKQMLIIFQSQLEREEKKLIDHIAMFLQKLHHQLDKINTYLDTINPNSTLKRGFSIITNIEGRMISHPSLLKHGETIIIKLYGAKIYTTINDINMDNEIN